MRTYDILDGSELIAEFVAPLTVRSNQPEFGTDALNLKRVISRRSPQRWEISTNLEPLVYDANKLFAHFVRHGHSSVFKILMPQNYGVVKQRTTRSHKASATAAINSETVSLASHTGLLPAGTFIKFDNHSKVYMVLEDCKSGNTSMKIYPRLRTAVSSTEFTCEDDVEMQAQFDLDVVVGMVYTDGILMDMGTVKIIEAL